MNRVKYLNTSEEKFGLYKKSAIHRIEKITHFMLIVNGRPKSPPANDEEERKEEENTDETRIKKKDLKKVSGMRKAYMIYFSHILFIVPLIAYVGIKKRKGT